MQLPQNSEDSHALTLKEARRDGQKVLLVRITAAGLAYITQVILARALGTSEYGIFATVWVWMTIFGHSALLGFGQSGNRFIPHYQVAARADLIRGFLWGGAGFVAALSVSLALLGGIVLFFLHAYLLSAYVAPFVIALCVLPLFALQDYVEGIARAFKWPILAIAPPYIVRQGLIALGVIVALINGVPAQAWVAVSVTLLATALTLVCQLFFLHKALKTILPSGERTYAVREWIITSLPMGLSDLVNVLLSFVDVVLLSFFVPPSQVGIYFAATRLMQIVAFIQYAASSATAPRLAQAHAEDNFTALQQLVTHTARLTALASSLTVIALIIASPWLLQLFGQSFASATPLMIIFGFGMIGQALLGPAEDTLNMSGYERVAARIAVIVLLTAITLNSVLIPYYGIWGAASAMALTQMIKGALLAHAAYITCHIWTPVR